MFRILIVVVLFQFFICLLRQSQKYALHLGTILAPFVFLFTRSKTDRPGMFEGNVGCGGNLLSIGESVHAH